MPIIEGRFRVVAGFPPGIAGKDGGSRPNCRSWPGVFAGVIGPQEGARFLDIFGNYYTEFITAAVLAFGLTFVTKKPTEKELEALARVQPAPAR